MVLETRRCYLSFTTDNDVPDFKALYADVNVWEYLGGIRNNEQINHDISSRIYPQNDCVHWTIRKKETNDFIGSISLAPHHDGFYMEVSYEFLSSSWGNGYASETVEKVIQYAFESLKLSTLVAETQSANTASCNMLRRLGFNETQKVTRFGFEQIVFTIKNPATEV